MRRWIVVLPSYREGMPRSILEAGAMGLPVVASDVPGCRNIVTDGFNGLLCQPHSSVSLADAMRRIIEMSEPEREALWVAMAGLAWRLDTVKRW